jgi:hypothetical protein
MKKTTRIRPLPFTSTDDMGHCSTTYFVIVSSNDVMDQDDEPDPINLEETLSEYLTNANLPTRCRTFGKELGVDDAKTLEDIYKSHFLEGGRVGFFRTISFFFSCRIWTNTVVLDAAVLAPYPLPHVFLAT